MNKICKYCKTDWNSTKRRCCNCGSTFYILENVEMIRNDLNESKDYQINNKNKQSSNKMIIIYILLLAFLFLIGKNAIKKSASDNASKKDEIVENSDNFIEDDKKTSGESIFDSKPVKYEELFLTSLTVISEDGYLSENVSESYSNTGDVYHHAFALSKPYKDKMYSSISYYLGKSYVEFKGIAYLSKYSKNTKSEMVLKIYGDDIELYSSPVFSEGTLPQNIVLDVTNVEFLTFKLSGSESLWDDVYVGNPMLVKIVE